MTYEAAAACCWLLVLDSGHIVNAAAEQGWQVGVTATTGLGHLSVGKEKEENPPIL